MVLYALHIFMQPPICGSPFDRMWFLSAVKAHERPGPPSIVQAISAWMKKVAERKKREAAKRWTYAKRQSWGEGGGDGRISYTRFEESCRNCPALHRMWTVWMLGPLARAYFLLVFFFLKAGCCIPPHHRSIWMECDGGRLFCCGLPPSASTEGLGLRDRPLRVCTGSELTQRKHTHTIHTTHTHIKRDFQRPQVHFTGGEYQPLKDVRSPRLRYCYSCARAFMYFLPCRKEKCP